jgi:hypothetical protein
MRRTDRSEDTSTSWSAPVTVSRMIFTAVNSRIAPKITNVQSTACTAAAPIAMNTPRSTRAPAMPYSRTRWVSTAGTANAAISSMNTNRLSTDNDFSSR